MAERHSQRLPLHGSGSVSRAGAAQLSPQADKGDKRARASMQLPGDVSGGLREIF